MQSASIVVIEDNVDFATILETVLQLWGYTAERYDTLGSGRAALRRRQPAMLILDGQLPDGEGIDLYYELRSAPATRGLPILLLSVSDDVFQVARAAADADPALYIGLKPMPLDDIHEIVTRVVGG
jgi:DNA-binding response OmpR family regulator